MIFVWGRQRKPLLPIADQRARCSNEGGRSSVLIFFLGGGRPLRKLA